MQRLVSTVIVAIAMTEAVISVSAVYAGEDSEPCKDAVAPGGQRERRIALDFQNVDIQIVAGFFDEQTGKHHVVQGFGPKFDLLERTPIPVAEAHRRFLSAAEQLGYTVSTDGDTIRLTAPGFVAPAPVSADHTAHGLPDPLGEQGADPASAAAHAQKFVVARNSNEGVSLNFDKTPVKAVALVLGQIMGRTYSVEGDGDERIDLKVEHPIPPQQAHELFMSAVADLGYAITEEAGVVHLRKDTARGGAPAAKLR